MVQIKVLSYAKFQAIVMAFSGIVAGLIYSVGGTIYDLQTIGLNKGTILAYIAIPVIPLYFAVFGFVTGIVGASIYNLFSKLIKIKMNFERWVSSKFRVKLLFNRVYN